MRTALTLLVVGAVALPFGATAADARVEVAVASTAAVARTPEPTPDEAPTETPTDPPPTETEPPTTDVPADEDGDDDGDDDGSSSDLVLWIVIVVLALATIAAIVALASRSSDRQSQRRAAGRSRQSEAARIITSAQWVHDQSITVLQINDQAQLRGAWDQMRNQILGVEREVTSAAARPGVGALAPAIGAVSTALSGLRSALEAAVALEVSPTPDPALVENAVQTVQVRRRQLEAALSDLSYRATAS